MANFDYRIKQVEESVLKIRSEYEEARDFTAILLDKAKSMGIKALGINKTSKKTQDSPWSEMHGYGIFAKERGDSGKGWPLVWRLAEEIGKLISGEKLKDLQAMSYKELTQTQYEAKKLEAGI